MRDLLAYEDMDNDPPVSREEMADTLTSRIIERELADIQWECNGASGHEREFILSADNARIYWNGDGWMMEAEDASWCEELTTVQDLRDALKR